MSRHHAAFLFLLTPVPPIMTAATRFHPLVSDLLELLALNLRGLPVFATEIARKPQSKIAYVSLSLAHSSHALPLSLFRPS